MKSGRPPDRSGPTPPFSDSLLFVFVCRLCLVVMFCKLVDGHQSDHGHTSVHVCLLVMIIHVYGLLARGRLPDRSGPTPPVTCIWVFGDVAFQNVGVRNAGFQPLTHISFRCKATTPSVAVGQ